MQYINYAERIHSLALYSHAGLSQLAVQFLIAYHVQNREGDCNT